MKKILSLLLSSEENKTHFFKIQKYDEETEKILTDSSLADLCRKKSLTVFLETTENNNVLPDAWRLFTVEKIPEVRKEALSNFEKYGVKDRVTSLIGDSLDVVKNLTKKFDFIFLDCNKAAYATLYPLLKDLLNDGGVIFADNILFRGYVAKEKECPKEYRTLVQKIDNYNQIASSDNEMITCFFDVGDGIAVSYKK